MCHYEIKRNKKRKYLEMDQIPFSIFLLIYWAIKGTNHIGAFVHGRITLTVTKVLIRTNLRQ